MSEYVTKKELREALNQESAEWEGCRKSWQEGDALSVAMAHLASHFAPREDEAPFEHHEVAYIPPSPERFSVEARARYREESIVERCSQLQDHITKVRNTALHAVDTFHSLGQTDLETGFRGAAEAFLVCLEAIEAVLTGTSFPWELDGDHGDLYDDLHDDVTF